MNFLLKAANLCIAQANIPFIICVLAMMIMVIEILGAFQLKYFKHNIQELDRMIFDSLSQHYLEGRADFSKIVKYLDYKSEFV